MLALDPSIYGWIADAIVVAHLGVVLYSLFGEVLILIGWVAGWSWVRNLWFRLSHLAVILFVAVQAAYDGICPLTQWEYDLRRAAGQEFDEGSFIGRLAHDLLFVDVPQATLNIVYIGFAVLVLVTLFGCPPRRRSGSVSPG